MKTKQLWNWQSFGGWISDISVNSYNDFAAIGGSGTIWGWETELKRWRQYPGNKSGGIAITILANNDLFVCFRNHMEIFRTDKKNKDRFKGTWSKIPGCCRDIDSDGYNLLMAIGCDVYPHGNGIWRNHGGPAFNQWSRVSGQALTIAVGSLGHIVVNNKQNNIYYKENINSQWVMTSGKAKDVSISVGGRIVVIGMDNHIYWSKKGGSRPEWVKNNGMGFRVSTWSWRNPMVVGMDHAGWRAIKN